MDLSATLLVVEDDVLVRWMIADYLRGAGFEVLEAGTADEAIGMLQSGAHVELVFSDIRMPGSMDGRALAARIRSDWPEIAVILTTGYANTDPRLTNGSEFLVLPKPYRPHAVLSAIEYLVAAKRPPAHH